MDWNWNAISGNGGARALIPQGRYRLEIEKADYKPNKSGTGAYVKAQFKVIGPVHAGARFWHYFNIKNDNERAQRMGIAELVSLYQACGISPQYPPDTLCGRTVIATVFIKKSNNPQYNDDNRAKDFKPDTMTGASAQPAINAGTMPPVKNAAAPMPMQNGGFNPPYNAYNGSAIDGPINATAPKMAANGDYNDNSPF